MPSVNFAQFLGLDVLPLKRRYLRNLALRIADIPKSILIRWPMLLHFAEWQHVLPGMTAIRIAEG